MKRGRKSKADISFSYLFDGVDLAALVRQVMDCHFIMRRSPTGLGRPALPPGDAEDFTNVILQAGYQPEHFMLSMAGDAADPSPSQEKGTYDPRHYFPDLVVKTDLAPTTTTDGYPEDSMSSRPHCRSERNHAILRDCLAGATVRELAQKHGISKQRVHQIIKSLGASVPKPEKRVYDQELLDESSEEPLPEVSVNPDRVQKDIHKHFPALAADLLHDLDDESRAPDNVPCDRFPGTPEQP